MIEIQYILIKDLKLLERNPRKIDKPQFEKLVKSLQEDKDFFDCRPCLVNIEEDGTKRVYAGNQRVQAAKKLKWKQVPCIVDNGLDENIIKSRILKDNLHYGIFDDDILMADYDISTLVDAGFTPEQLTGDYGNIEEVKSKDQEEKSEKLKMCPACGHEF